MNIAVFTCNISSAILQSKFFFLFPFVLVLGKNGVWFEHETIMRTMIWELIQRRGGDVPRNVIGFFNCDLLKTLWLAAFETSLQRSSATSYRLTIDTSWWCTTETSLCVSFEISLGRRGDVPRRIVVPHS